LVAYVFDKILQAGEAQGFTKTQQATQWYRTAAQRTTVNPQTLIRSDRARFRIYPTFGEMYIFNYDPKFKETLPYYDRFPLVFPFEASRKRGRPQGDGFYGINLHYLPLRLRARLMDGLYQYVSETDDQKRIEMNYRMLNQVSKLRFFKPCVKHYLFDHVRSKFFFVDPKEWDIALFLPLERFAKASKSVVWRESISRI